MILLFTPEVWGQDDSRAPATRADQIREQRLDKARRLESEQAAPGENISSRAGHLIQFIPIHFDIGGLGPGAGPAIDSRFQETYRGSITAKLWGHLAVHDFYSAGAGAEWRKVSPHNVIIGIDGLHSDAPQLEYYGPGPNSSIHNRTDFRREDTLFNIHAELHTHHDMTEACRLGALLLNVGPGTNDKLATTQAKFTPGEAPGLDVQSNYWIGGCSARLDLRDFSQDPHKGTYAAATVDRYSAQSIGRFSFYRASFAGEEYVPFFNRKRVVALQAKTDLSFHSHDQAVPFFLQPTLGSDEDLRGFRRYRFYDENSISLTAEYRWEINTGFDMALFADGGKVFHEPGQIGLSHLETSAGFGFRFKNQSERKVIARLDTGFSREGFEIWLRVPELF